MIKAMLQYFGFGLRDNKKKNVVILFMIYMATVFGVALSPMSLELSIIIILIILLIFLVAFVPFISWYLVYYKSESEKV